MDVKMKIKISLNGYRGTSFYCLFSNSLFKIIGIPLLYFYLNEEEAESIILRQFSLLTKCVTIFIVNEMSKKVRFFMFLNAP